ncbi:MAG: helix-turn-helix domain-containing protein [Candidatus Lokiarchaeia archaeon]
MKKMKRMTRNRIKSFLEDLLTPEELCSMLKVKKQRLYEWVHLNRIPYIKVGRFLRFSRSDIEAWLQSKSSDIIGPETGNE